MSAGGGKCFSISPPTKELQCCDLINVWIILSRSAKDKKDLVLSLSLHYIREVKERSKITVEHKAEYHQHNSGNKCVS